ncbi:MAG TPA: sodium:proton antiporter NhaD [Candidatus Saccharimonadales bacterium]|nr:sodium:proton antiporter NhaD [Candidatus Saccharimonadales bacterium]
MDLIGALAALVFCSGYFLIALEQRFNTHKSAIALIMAGILWLLAAIQGGEHFDEVVTHNAVDVLGVVAFSLASMALIEILAHYRFFDWIRMQLMKLHLDDKGQFILMMAMTFFLSGFLDNISLTISMILVARKFFQGKNLLIAAAAVVIAANGGGAWSPIGDVTSLLLWISGKVTAWQLISTAFIPTAALVATAGFLLYRQLSPADFIEHDKDEKVTLGLSEKVIIGSALISFILPLAFNSIGVQAFIGRLFGLGITWALIELAKSKFTKRESHMSANIEKIIQSIDISSLTFIMGILLSVGALTSIGVLSYLSSIAVGANPSHEWIVFLGSVLGLASGIVDNSALMAISLQVFPITDPSLWGLIAITTGTGGSLLIFASAAGVVAMGSLKQLDVKTYLKIGSLPAMAGLAVAIIVWIIQDRIVNM